MDTMHALRLPVPFPSLRVLSRLNPPLPLRSFLRLTGYRLRPPQPLPHVPLVNRSATAVLQRGEARPHQAARILIESRMGELPTIVLGGFVPDSTEQVYLLRGMLLRHGSVYYVNYPRTGFSPDMICAQIDDLVEELALRGQSPVILAVSFGAAILVEWLRRRAASLGPPAIAGAVLVSPVACHDDIVDPGEARPSTLLGRALKPFSGAVVDSAAVERARTIFTQMFDAGSKNRAALAGLLSAEELLRLKGAVTSSIRGIDSAGACERVRALGKLAHPETWARAGAPLCEAPILILYAEREDQVMAAHAPTPRVLARDGKLLFPASETRTVAGGESPVQHASLIFHYYQFLPHFAGFYRRLKQSKLVLAV